MSVCWKHSFSAQPHAPATELWQPALSCLPAMALLCPQQWCPLDQWLSLSPSVAVNNTVACTVMTLLELSSRQAGCIWGCSLEMTPATCCGCLLKAACLHPASLEGKPPLQVSSLGLLQGQLPVAPLRCQACVGRFWCGACLIQAIRILGW